VSSFASSNHSTTVLARPDTEAACAAPAGQQASQTTAAQINIRCQLITLPPEKMMAETISQ
jgi:hypothetical protein